MGYYNLKFDTNAVFLVTGGAGFIGSNICEALLDMGYAVRCLDDLSTGKKENISQFESNERFTFIHGDIRDYSTCLGVSCGADFILHQAAWGSVPRSIENPLDYEKINILGTLNMLEASRVNNVKKFVYASSSSVYGDEASLPKTEGKEGTLLSPYAITKKTNEEYGKLYSRLFGVDTYGLRYFNVFGRRQDPDGDYAAVIPKFIKQLITGQQPIVYGDGKQSRDFTYIDNVIEANLKACLAPGEYAGDVYNIGCGGREYIVDVFHKLCSLLGKDGTEPVFGPERAGDIKHSFADVSKAMNKLGYKAQWGFEAGIEASIDWYKENI